MPSVTLLSAHIALCTSVVYVFKQEPKNAQRTTMATITKTAFVADLAETHHINRQTAQEAVNAVVATMPQALIDGHGIKLPELGTFSPKERAGRTGRNPTTGESLDIPAKRTVQFKVASDLQRQIRQPE